LGLSLQGRSGARGRAVAWSSIVPDLHLARSGAVELAQIAVIAGSVTLA
jgi:hypothetical protein